MSSETLIPHSKSPNPPLINHSNPLQPTTPKWLHRLRISRGFPDSDHIDLEHFLSTSAHQTPPPLSQTHDSNGSIQHPQRKSDLINNVLSDLFHMGDFNNTSGNKKCCRKQNCPKLCVVVSTEKKKGLDVENVRKAKRKVKEVSRVTEEGEEKGEWDVSACSQTEVTVIDTSVPCWKFEKVLYRNKNVWRVGDKGLGLVSGNGKKMKERLNESDVRKKKLKKKMKLSGSLNVSKFDPGVEHGKKRVDEGCSSVVLIKSILTTNKKTVSGGSNGSVKSMQR